MFYILFYRLSMSSVVEQFGITEDVFNELSSAISRLKMGDFSVKLPADKYSGKIASTLEEFNSFIDDMRALFGEITRVADEASKGNLSVRASVTAYGDYAELVENVNRLIDSIVVPIREGISVVRSYASGDFRRRVGGDIKMEGEFKAFAEALNELGESLQNFIGVVRSAGGESVEGMREVREAVNQINAGMQQISAASQQMAQGAANLSRLANETAAEAKSVVESIKSLTEEAQISAEAAKKSC